MFLERECSVKQDAESLDGLRLGLVRKIVGRGIPVGENDMLELIRRRCSPQGRSRLAGASCPLRWTARIVPSRTIVRGARRRRAVEIPS